MMEDGGGRWSSRRKLRRYGARVDMEGLGLLVKLRVAGKDEDRHTFLLSLKGWSSPSSSLNKEATVPFQLRRNLIAPDWDPTTKRSSIACFTDLPKRNDESTTRKLNGDSSASVIGLQYISGVAVVFNLMAHFLSLAFQKRSPACWQMSPELAS